MKQPIDFINYAAWEQGYVPPTNHRLIGRPQLSAPPQRILLSAAGSQALQR